MDTRLVWDALGQVPDPEIPVISVVDLGIVRDVHFEDAHRLYRRFGFRCTRFRYAPDPWQSREWGFELDLGQMAVGLV